MEHLFGIIDNGKMVLSRLGVIADVLWYEIPRQSPHIELGNFVVMPNHLHGILVLNNRGINGKNDGGCGGRNDGRCRKRCGGGDNDRCDGGDNERSDNGTVETLRATSLPPPPATSAQRSAISPQRGSVSAIIRSYKSAVTKHANRLGLQNGWQERFHDHIIRNDAEYQRISEYIAANPGNWHRDKFHG